MAKPRLKKPDTTPVVVKQHTDLSPSNAERWMNCPGSVALCKTCPKPPQSEYAAEGEQAHALLERCLVSPAINPFDFVGGDGVTEEMAECVQFAREQIQQELQKGGELLTEQNLTIFPGIGGTLDAAVIREFDSITIFDFKYGKGQIVSAVDNVQMLLYMLGLLRDHDVPKLKLVIIQPRTDNQVSTWEVESSYMETFKAEVERRIALTKETNALVAAGSWCKWCWAKVVCPVLRQDISAQLPAVQNRDLIFPDVKGLSVEVLTRVLDIRDRFDDWINAVFAYAQEYCEAGGNIPGWELAQKRTNRKWADEATALAAFGDLGEKAYKISLLSPAQMEKIAGKERVAELTIVPEGGTTLKKITETKEKKTKVKMEDLL